jgi:hypothetical protein
VVADFRIQIASRPDEPECVAEIWFCSEQVAELSFGSQDELVIRTFGGQHGDPLVFEFARYDVALQLARRTLVDGRAPKTDTSRYEQLLLLFTAGLMSVENYEKRYVEAFQSDLQIHRTIVHEVLNRLFTDLDVFNPDAGDRLEYEIDFETLLSNAKTGLRELRDLRMMPSPKP